MFCTSIFFFLFFFNIFSAVLTLWLILFDVWDFLLWVWLMDGWLWAQVDCQGEAGSQGAGMTLRSINLTHSTANASTAFPLPASEEHIMSTWLCAPLDRWADVISEQEVSRTEIFPAGWGTWKLFQEEQKRSVTLSKVGTDTFEKWVAYKRKLKEKDDERIKLLFQSLSHSRESSFVIFLGVLLQSLPHPDTPLIAACTH